MEENRNATNPSANSPEEISGFSLHDLLQLVIGNWFWFLLSTVICLSCALFYIYTTPKIYKRTATILIKDGKKGNDCHNKRQHPAKPDVQPADQPLQPIQRRPRQKGKQHPQKD